MLKPKNQTMSGGTTYDEIMSDATVKTNIQNICSDGFDFNTQAFEACDYLKNELLPVDEYNIYVSNAIVTAIMKTINIQFDNKAIVYCGLLNIIVNQFDYMLRNNTTDLKFIKDHLIYSIRVVAPYIPINEFFVRVVSVAQTLMKYINPSESYFDMCSALMYNYSDFNLFHEFFMSNDKINQNLNNLVYILNCYVESCRNNEIFRAKYDDNMEIIKKVVEMIGIHGEQITETERFIDAIIDLIEKLNNFNNESDLIDYYFSLLMDIAAKKPIKPNLSMYILYAYLDTFSDVPESESKLYSTINFARNGAIQFLIGGATEGHLPDCDVSLFMSLLKTLINYYDYPYRDGDNPAPYFTTVNNLININQPSTYDVCKIVEFLYSTMNVAHDGGQEVCSALITYLNNFIDVAINDVNFVCYVNMALKMRAYLNN